MDLSFIEFLNLFPNNFENPHYFLQSKKAKQKKKIELREII